MAQFSPVGIFWRVESRDSQARRPCSQGTSSRYLGFLPGLRAARQVAAFWIYLASRFQASFNSGLSLCKKEWKTQPEVPSEDQHAPSLRRGAQQDRIGKTRNAGYSLRMNGPPTPAGEAPAGRRAGLPAPRLSWARPCPPSSGPAPPVWPVPPARARRICTRFSARAPVPRHSSHL